MSDDKPCKPAIQHKRWYQAPAGKPKLSLAAVIRRRLDPNEYFEFMLRIARDELIDHKTRMVAWNHLAERGWGKPLTQVAIDAEFSHSEAEKVDLSALSDKELEAYEKALLKLASGPTIIDVESSDD